MLLFKIQCICSLFYMGFFRSMHQKMQKKHGIRVLWSTPNGIQNNFTSSPSLVKAYVYSVMNLHIIDNVRKTHGALSLILKNDFIHSETTQNVTCLRSFSMMSTAHWWVSINLQTIQISYSFLIQKHVDTIDKTNIYNEYRTMYGWT